jgi:hypothetical protein
MAPNRHAPPSISRVVVVLPAPAATDAAVDETPVVDGGAAWVDEHAVAELRTSAAPRNELILV